MELHGKNVFLINLKYLNGVSSSVENHENLEYFWQLEINQIFLNGCINTKNKCLQQYNTKDKKAWCIHV